MKKFIVLLLLFISIYTLKAQSYVGYTFDNYAGVQSLISNPANIVDSRFRTDVNILSASSHLAQDFFGLKTSDLLNNNNVDNDTYKYPSTNNNFLLNADVLLPSFMMNLTPNHSIALSIRVRSNGNVSNINGEFYDRTRDRFDSSNSFITPSENFNIVSNAWAEYGFTYAAVLSNKGKNFFKGGLTIKYLEGIANSYLKADNVSTSYVKGTDSSNSFITTTGSITYGGNNNFETINPINNGSGIGADIGFIYEYRPDFENFVGAKNKNKYKYKIGVSITDFGSINYKNNQEKKYDVNKTIVENQYNSSSTGDFLAANYTLISNNESSTYSLPTALHLNLDWNMHNKFYLNFNADQKVTNTSALNTNTVANNYSLIPRFETKWFSFYLPLNLTEYTGFQAGTGLRLGPLFVGSGSIITNLLSNKSKGLDIHAGLKVPIYQGKIKDKDEDGVPDSEDDCRSEAGPAENKGCPYRDSDKDGVLDKDDKCPDVAGNVQNLGCPYIDTDKDGILDKDDKCVNEAGPKENNGCPYLDSDKDGVLDKDDNCPTVFGIVENKGCPEIKKAEPVKVESIKVVIADEVIKKINEFSKTILFDSGKATLKAESNTSLDGIVIVLNEYQNANFKIEGHTDSAGIPAKNLKLSQDRSAAVKQYLIDKGVRADRLTSEGYGSKKPIASNKTPKGKNLNRRVEINLVK